MNNCHMMCSNSAEYIWHSDSGSIISPIHSWSGRKVFYRSITPQKLRCLCSSSTSGLLFVSRILHQSCRSMTPILYLWQVYSSFRFLATGVHPNLFIPVLVQSLLRIIIDSSPSSVVYFSLPWSLRRLWVNIASLIKKNRLFVCPSVVIRWSSEKNFASLLFSCDCYVNTTRLLVHLYKSPRLSLSPFNHCAGRQYVVTFYSEAGSSYHLLGRLLPLCSSR